jgi:hypothetical protein
VEGQVGAAKLYSIAVTCCEWGVVYHIDFLPCYTCPRPCAVPTRDAHLLERYLSGSIRREGRSLARVLRTLGSRTFDVTYSSTEGAVCDTVHGSRQRSRKTKAILAGLDRYDTASRRDSIEEFISGVRDWPRRLPISNIPFTSDSLHWGQAG